MTYELVSIILGAAGQIQNPLFLILNYLGPSNYENSKITNYLSTGVVIFGTVIGIASILKLVSIQVLLTLETLGEIDSLRLALYQLKVLFLAWLPEFAYYVLPAMGTSAYLMSTGIHNYDDDY